MNDFLDRISSLSPRRLALVALELHDELEAERRRGREAIAIVGIGCRFPGAPDPAAYWRLLDEGREAIREVPADRWDIDALYDPDPDAPGKVSARAGGFLDRVDGFDAPFFGVSPREALTMDPQQRLLLEVSWEALEHAGIAPESLRGEACGVFVGVCNNDHYFRVVDRGNDAIDAYLASGNAPSVVAGRVAYVLGLQGPALAIDTACSSSLVALHAACQSLRSGQTRVALAGGVNVMCSPETMIALSKAHMLAPDGRCKTFDAAADGFARGEGCGVIVLKRLADAEADGDRVLAVIRGIGTNQDGRSGGLTVPNGPAQEAVIRAALADAGLEPADIDYVEAHGTGTTLGDPIEVRALAGALGPGRDPARPLLVGSVKTNFGHLESAAGIAGIIKVVLALQGGRIPRHLNFHEPSPHIAWSAYPVKVVAEATPWPRGERPRRAGISSFGFSGTNAHVVLEEAPLPVAPAEQPASRPLCVVPVSARSEAALRDACVAMAQLLEQPGADLGAIAHTAGVGRSHFAERVAVVAATATEAASALRAAAAGGTHPALHRGTARGDRIPEVVFLYTGQGAQHPGMARELYETSPVYRGAIDRCDSILGTRGGRTLRDVLFEPQGESPAIHQTDWTQPALFALEYALTELWRSWGIEPAAVIGHSVGEYVAACAAGVFTLDEGLGLIARRAILMHGLPPGGAMAAIFAPAGEVAAELRGRPGLSIAAINAPDNTVVAGDAKELDALLAHLAPRNVQGQRLFVSLAGHSPLTEPILDGMEECARAVTMLPPRIPVAWNLTGTLRLPGNGAPTPEYWRRHLREPVRFADGIVALHREGYRAFLEVGPHPTLMALAQRSLPGADVVWATSLRRNKPDWPELLGSVAALYVAGAPVDWAGLDRPQVRDRAVLPTYPFQRKRFWIDPAAPRPSPGEASPATLPGRRLPTADPTFEVHLGEATTPWLMQHRVLERVVVPGPLYLEWAQAAAREAFGPAARAVEDFVVHSPLVPGEAGRIAQLSLTGDGHAVTFRIHGRAVDATAWHLHASGRLVPVAEVAPLGGDRAPASGGMDGDAYYERLSRLGIGFGPVFRPIRRGTARPGGAAAELELDPSVVGEPVAWVHPALLDGLLQSIGLADEDPDPQLAVLTGIGRAAIVASPVPARLAARIHVRARPTGTSPEWLADIDIEGTDGARVGWLRDVRLRRASRAVLEQALGGPAGPVPFHEVTWRQANGAGRGSAPAMDTVMLAAPAAKAFEALGPAHGVEAYDTLLPALDELSAMYAVDALRSLGFDTTPGRLVTLDAEVAALGVAPRHRALFRRLLEIMADDGLLEPEGAGRYRVGDGFPQRTIEAWVGSVRAIAGENDGELSMLLRAGPQLARVLVGAQDPLQLLFPGGSFAEARKLYVESPFARTWNGALLAAMRALVAGMPAGRRLRVLEVGGGTGGTTSYLLPELAAMLDYTFTDVSPLFLARAAEQFSGPAFRTRLLDIERPPAAQGFAEGAYDVIIAANVLHATADLSVALAHARALLVPGGSLLLLEGTAPERWVDLTFGLTDGWWRFTDLHRRPSYPLLARDAWLELLDESGFVAPVALPRRVDGRAARQQALFIAQARPAPRTFTLVRDRGGVAEAVARRLAARGDQVRQVEPSDAVMDGDLVYLAALDLDGIPATPDDVARCERLSMDVPLQHLAAHARSAGGRAWLVTAGAVCTHDDELMPGAAQAPLWGIGRVFSLEQPGLWGGLVDVDPSDPLEARVDAILATLDAGDAEDQSAWRSGSRLVPRLAEVPVPPRKSLALRGDGAYLVTGGLGGLGVEVARWLARSGAGTVVLLGRNPAGHPGAAKEVERAGAHVVVTAGDVADEDAMRALLARFGRDLPELRGIVHAAADLSTGVVTDLATEQVVRMARPKVAGTVMLDRLTANHRLDFLVLFSSSTAILGAAGFAHYAAANRFLDAFALARHRPGRPVVSVNWGTWEVMRSVPEEVRESYRRTGLEPMPVADAFDALERLVGSGRAGAIVARVDWNIMRSLFESRRPQPLFDLLDAPAPEAPRAATAPALLDQLDRTPPGERRHVLLGFVAGEVRAVLGIAGDEPLPPSSGLFELGMDSLMSVELKRRLDAGTGRTLPSTLTFNYPTVAALAGFLDQELAPAVQPAEPDGQDDADDLEARLMARLAELQ